MTFLKRECYRRAFVQQLAKGKATVFTPRRRRIGLIGLLISLLCISLISSVSIAGTDLGDELLNTNPI
ncbi:MAG: hypothetical protein ACXW4A_10445, partial [Nitrospira sp.]